METSGDTEGEWTSEGESEFEITKRTHSQKQFTLFFFPEFIFLFSLLVPTVSEAEKTIGFVPKASLGGRSVISSCA